MALKTYSNNRPPRPSSGEMMTVEELRRWLKRFDADGNGLISKDELRDAIRSAGGRVSGWRSGQAVRQADSDGDGFVGDDEIKNLVAFVKKTLGVKIVPY